MASLPFTMHPEPLDTLTMFDLATLVVFTKIRRRRVAVDNRHVAKWVASRMFSPTYIHSLAPGTGGAYFTISSYAPAHPKLLADLRLHSGETNRVAFDKRTTRLSLVCCSIMLGSFPTPSSVPSSLVQSHHPRGRTTSAERMFRNSGSGSKPHGGITYRDGFGNEDAQMF